MAQYWHERYHADPGNQWLRGLFAQLYGGRQRTPAVLVGQPEQPCGLLEC